MNHRKLIIILIFKNLNFNLINIHYHYLIKNQIFRFLIILFNKYHLHYLIIIIIIII